MIRPSEEPENEDSDYDPLTIEELPWVIRPKHIQRFFQMGKDQAYDLVKSEGFPSRQFRKGGAIRTLKPDFIEWLKGEDN